MVIVDRQLPWLVQERCINRAQHQRPFFAPNTLTVTCAPSTDVCGVPEQSQMKFFVLPIKSVRVAINMLFSTISALGLQVKLLPTHVKPVFKQPPATMHRYGVLIPKFVALRGAKTQHIKLLLAVCRPVLAAKSHAAQPQNVQDVLQ